jgi:hypothetical protein
MTSSHGPTSLDNAVFQFKYQNSTCRGSGASVAKSVHGSKVLARDSTANKTNGDFRLLCVTERIPKPADAFHSGWNRSGAPPASSVSIHHPKSYPKSISVDSDSPTKVGPEWLIGTWEHGATEPGSSGGPLYGSDQRFIGQLHTGTGSTCSTVNNSYGALDAYWMKVRRYLDPLDHIAQQGTTQQINGLDPDKGGSDPSVGYYKVKGKTTGTVDGDSDTVKFKDEFVFFPNHTFTLYYGNGTWTKAKQAGKWIYTCNIKPSLQDFLDDNLPPGVHAQVVHYKFVNGELSANDANLDMHQDGKIKINDHGKKFTIKYSGHFTCTKDCGCS